MAVAHSARQQNTRVFLVGGAIRDCLRGIATSRDCDFVVDGNPLHFAESFARKVRGTVVPWDSDQVRVAFCSNGDKIYFDFSRMRGGSIEEDLCLRDFTVNACAVAVQDLVDHDGPSVIDPCGGRDDLAAGVIRCCSQACFDQDPVRMLRAVRIARECNFRIDSFTEDLMASKSSLITEAPVERIKREFFLILGLPGAHDSLRELDRSGILGRLLPEIEKMRHVRQSPPHRHTLYEHQMQTVYYIDMMRKEGYRQFESHSQQMYELCSCMIEENISRYALLVFAGFIHDIGKMHTMGTREGRVTFYGHERIGSEMGRTIARRCGLGRTAQKNIIKLISSHMRIFQLCLLKTITERAKVRLIRDCEEIFWELIVLACADHMAKEASGQEEAAMAERIQRLCLELAEKRSSSTYVNESRPLLSGHDIQRILALPEGPEIGEILSELYEREQQGLCSTREEALAWLMTKKRSR